MEWIVDLSGRSSSVACLRLDVPKFGRDEWYHTIACGNGMFGTLLESAVSWEAGCMRAMDLQSWAHAELSRFSQQRPSLHG